MRRFLAYIVMMLTLVCALIFNTQAVLDQKTDAMEYGSGTELVYSLSNRSKDDYDLEGNTNLGTYGTKTLDEIDIEGVIMQRLDMAGIRNASVRIVEGNKETQEGYQLRVSFSPLNESDLNRVKDIIGITGSLAAGTVGDDTVMYADGGKFFDTSADDFATVEYVGNVPYPSLKVIPADYDKMVEAAKEAAEAHKNDKQPDDATDPDSNADTSLSGTNSLNGNKALYAATPREGEDGGSQEGEGEDTTPAHSTDFFLWTNKTISDTYDKAFGTNDTIVQQEVKDKVLAVVDLTNYDSATHRIQIVSDIEGNAFDVASAYAFVNMLNAKDYGFDVEYLYQNTIPPTFGANGLTITFAVSGAILGLIAILMVVFYGLAGITASLNLCASILLSFFLFSVLGFEFSVAALVGLSVLTILSLLISINYFERVKAELRKGRDCEKANREGYHKSFFTSLDSSIVVFLTSIFGFLLATGSYKTVLGVIMIGAAFTFIITNYVNKWMMYWMTKGNNDPKLYNKFLFGNVSIKEKKQVAVINSKHNGKLRSWLVPLIAALAIGVSLPTSYFVTKDGSFFNNSNDFTSGYTFNIEFSGESQRYEALATKANFLDYLENMGQTEEALENNEAYIMYANNEEMPENLTGVPFTYDPSSVYVNIVEKKDEEGNAYFNHYFTFTTNVDLNTLTLGSNKDVTSFIRDAILGSEVELDDGTIIAPGSGSYSHFNRDSLNVGCYVTLPTNVAHSYNAMFMLSFLISVFAAIYLLIRYGLNIALSSLVSGTVTSALGISLMVICRIPFSSYTGFALIAIALLVNVFAIFVLGGNKEKLKELKIRKTATPEQRMEIANEMAQRSSYLIVFTGAVYALLGVGLFFVNPALIGLSISLIVFTIMSVALLYFFTVPFYTYLSIHLQFKKISQKWDAYKEKKGKKKEQKVSEDGIVYVDNGPHETIIVGLNEFHH